MDEDVLFAELERLIHLGQIAESHHPMIEYASDMNPLIQKIRIVYDGNKQLRIDVPYANAGLMDILNYLFKAATMINPMVQEIIDLKAENKKYQELFNFTIKI